ncbi:MAG: hypothetical protein IPN29_16755 [Saprospiraceae bacterium]|nr:hypothetical protein [Saprospiraceae bacterium]
MKSVSWSCPSNIAIVKYWGKYGRQLPRNTSISFTLNNALSTTKLAYRPKEGQLGQIKFFLDGVEKPGFIPKIEKFFKGITADMPFIADYDFEIESHNTFPHSSGIASSASGMGALAMCLCDIESGFMGGTDIDIQGPQNCKIGQWQCLSICFSSNGTVGKT